MNWAPKRLSGKVAPVTFLGHLLPAVSRRTT